MGRTTATVLFTDLVGSTELRGRLGEEAAEELRRRHDRLLTEAVEAHNGRVVKGLGDGIMATFPGASDAVAAAVAIQQAIDRLNRSGKAAVPLALRVGLSAGDVTVEDDDVHGTPVIEAARLCAAAGGGEILVSEVVRLLAGAGDWDFAPRGPLQLKGLLDPIPAWEVRWEPTTVSSIPMPGLLTDVGRIFVGRAAELERLAQLWKEATAGERRVAFLAGEPGVGKTRLAAELATQVHQEGAVVLAGRCDEDLGVPYQPFVEALRYFVDHAPAGDLRERLGRYGGELARLVPELGERVPDLPPPLRSDPETERYRLFDAVAAWLGAASVDQPLLVVLDDLQWAAKPTLLLLRHVVRAADATRVLVLGTYRDSELTHDHPLVGVVADLRREGGLERVSLSGLDDLGVAAIVERAGGQALDEEGVALARAIYEETEGNPFFVREVLRHLVESGAVERRGDGWATRMAVGELGIPEGVRDVVGRRLSRLSDAANRALATASVVGLEFEAPVVLSAGRLDEDDLFAALDEAVASRLLSEVPGPVPRYRFAHALVRATLYDQLSGAHRVGLHRRVAEAIEAVHVNRLDDHLPALAHHWARAAAPAAEARRAVDYATRAGDRALAQLAHDEAAAYYHSALDLLDAAEADDDDRRRLELLISLGEAQRRAGDAAHRETLLDAAHLAQRLGDVGALTRAALANTPGSKPAVFGRTDSERVAVLEAALAAVEGGDNPARARLLAILALELFHTGERARRLALSDEALARARRLDDPATLAHVLMARPFAIGGPDTLAERLADTAELLEVASRLGDPFTAYRAWWLRYRVAIEAADIAEADRCLASQERLIAELGQPAVRWMTMLQYVARALLAGDLEAAERLVVPTREQGRLAGQPDAPIYHGLHLFHLRFEQGRPDEAADTVRSIVAGAPELPAARAVLGWLCAESGRLTEAATLVHEVAPAGFASVPVEASTMAAFACCTATIAVLGNADWAADLHPVLVPYADQVAVYGMGLGVGSVAYHLGLLAHTMGSFDEAQDRFAAAAVLDERIGAPTWLARTRLEWARTLLTRRQGSDAGRARELLGQALTTARELGLANVERRAVALVQDCP